MKLNAIIFIILMLIIVMCLGAVVFYGAWWHIPMALGCGAMAKLIYSHDGDDSVCNLVKELRRR